MSLFAIQHKLTKCYLLFVSTEENVVKDASQLISTKANKFFELCPEVKSYKIGNIEDFDINVINEINSKTGKQYEELKEDDYCINTNLDKCVEMLNMKLSAKPKAKKAPTKSIEEPSKTIKEPSKPIEESKVTEEVKPKPKPKPRSKKSDQISQ